MADVKISQLSLAGSADGTESVEVVKAGTSMKLTTAMIAALVPAGVTAHAQLTGLGADDHPQYLNTARGDVRYPQLTRALIAGNGLTGGGDLSADRTFNVGAGQGVSVAADSVAVDIVGTAGLSGAVDAASDLLLLYDASTASLKSVVVGNVIAAGSGTVPNSRAVNAGTGLTGGGTLGADITLNVGAGTGISVAADSVGLDTASTRNTDHAGVAISAGTGLTGGGPITASSAIALDTANTRNIDHAAVAVTGANSLAGGGDITASRSLTLTNDAANPGSFAYYGTNVTANAKGWWPFSTTNLLLNSLGVGTAASGTAGEIRATNDVTAFFSSDRRLKENIRPISGALGLICRIRGVWFDWTDEYIAQRGGEDGYFIRRHDVGVIAQEIETVIPEVVAERNDEMKTKAVKYDRLVPVLIQAIKELSEEVRVLKERVR